MDPTPVPVPMLTGGIGSLIVVLLAVFGAVWLFKTTLRSGSRWTELLRYARYGNPPASVLRAKWIRIGLCRFKGCTVKVALTDEGLYLDVGSMAGPPLLVPWSDIEADGQGGFLLGESRVPLQVRDSLARRIHSYLEPKAAIAVAAGDPSRCPYCHGGLEGLPLGACVGCGTQHHAECLVEHGGCAVPGCDRQPERGARPSQKDPA